MFYRAELPTWLRRFPIHEAVFPILPWRRSGSVVEADVHDEFGTAFFIGVSGDRGLFATAAHCVQHHETRMYRLHIPSKARRLLTCQVGRLWFHPVADCVVGQVALSVQPGERPSALEIDHRPLRPDQSVASVGWPEPGREEWETDTGLALRLDLNLRAVEGTVNERLENGYIRKGYPVWSTTCSARGGHSGGPLFAVGGRGVRGILSEGGEGHGVFVDVQAVRDILAKYGIRRRGG
jgi:hypothetical protein